MQIPHLRDFDLSKRPINALGMGMAGIGWCLNTTIGNRKMQNDKEHKKALFAKQYFLLHWPKACDSSFVLSSPGCSSAGSVWQWTKNLLIRLDLTSSETVLCDKLRAQSRTLALSVYFLAATWLTRDKHNRSLQRHLFANHTKTLWRNNLGIAVT